MTTIMVAAVARNGVIGTDGDLAWRSTDDLQRLRAMTMGHTLVMGRRNFEAIGRPLPGRRTVVVTRQRSWHVPGVSVVHDTGPGLDAELARIAETSGDDTVFIFGGGEIYAQLLDRADVLELTEVHQDLAGDTYFPTVDWSQWREVSREPRGGFSWVRYERVQPATEGADGSAR